MGYGVASKPKSYNNSLTPLTVLMLRQVQADPLQIIDNIEVAKALIVARIISIKSMNGRLLLKVTDGTEVVQIIQGSLN